MSAQKIIDDFLVEYLPKKVHHKGWSTHKEMLKTKALMLDTIPKVRIKKRSRAKGLSAREKRALGLYHIPKDNQKYDNFLPLHKLWKDYMRSILPLNTDMNLKTVEHKLLKADYHGAAIKVLRSKCPSYVGLSGIVIQETKNMFKLITRDDKVKAIPKFNSVFRIELDGYGFDIYGNNFRFRSGDRSARKFKSKPFCDI